LSHKNKETAVNLTEGQEIMLSIEDLAYEGNGVAKHDNFTIFVPFGVPGDKVKAKITDIKKNFAVAHIKEVILKSPLHTKAMCPHFMVCGGCHWLNVIYTAQAKFKLKILNSMLEKIAKAPGVKAEKIITYKNPFFYRNRAQYKVALENDRLSIGFYKAETHEVVDIHKCYIISEKINEIIDHIKNYLIKHKADITVYDEKKEHGFLRYIAIRVNRQGESLVTFVVTDEPAKHPHMAGIVKYLREKDPAIKGIMANINRTKGNRIFDDKEAALWGESCITKKFRGIDYMLGSDTFFQINTDMLENMTGFIEKYINEGDTVVDLYGGVGTLSLPFYKKLKKLIIVEINKNSIDMLKEMIKKNGIKNTEVINADAEQVIDEVFKKNTSSTLILDPPRKGLAQGTLEAIKRHRVKHIIYISCDPATYSRDLGELKDLYNVREITALDLFPHTYHIETMSKLELSNNSEFRQDTLED